MAHGEIFGYWSRLLFLFALIAPLSSFRAVANEDWVGLLKDGPQWTLHSPPAALSPLYAQAEADDSYDPFADYSEFDEASDEEADINFFRNGRFFTLGFIGGYRGFTETLGQIYSAAPDFGLFLNYFFDLRFSMQLSFLTGDHTINFISPAKTQVIGTAAITAIGIDLKYYLNTQNVTRGLGRFNPYLIGGFSQVYRTATIAGISAFSKEGALAFDIGAGIEIPMMRNKMFLGFQTSYHLVNFKDENSEIHLAGGEETGIYPTGDFFNLAVILGINY